MSMLADLISASSQDSPASWSCDGLYCKICKNNTASYYLELGQNGDFSFWAQCSNHNDKLFSENGKFKIEKNIIYCLNNNKWKELLKITSVKPDKSVEGKNTILSLNIVNPYDKKASSLNLNGNILSDDNIAIQ